MHSENALVGVAYTIWLCVVRSSVHALAMYHTQLYMCCSIECVFIVAVFIRVYRKG